MTGGLDHANSRTCLPDAMIGKSDMDMAHRFDQLTPNDVYSQTWVAIAQE